MGVLSKFLVDILGLRVNKATCYEMMHTWNPNCYGAIVDSLWDGWLFSLKTYIIFYGLTSIFSAKNIRQVHWRKILIDSIRSSFFLTANLIIFLWLSCQLRKMLGFFTVPTLGLMNGIISALLAILIENRRRRPLLALYLTNLASETAYHQLVNHGYLKYIPNGVVIIFGFGLAGLLHLYYKDKLHTSLRKSIEYVLLMDETKELFPHQMIQRLYSPIGTALLMLRQRFPKHPLCRHQYSCISRFIEVFFNNFSQALIWSVGMVILQIGKAIIRQPAASIRRILRFRTMRLPLFYGFLALLFQVSRCGYSWCTNDISPLSFCGAVAALSLFFYPNISIAMYVFWKFIEGFFFSYYKNLMIPYGDIMLYALSTGYVAWNAVIEPQTLREGYWKFLVGLTGNKIELLNRRLFDNFGYNSSKKFPHFMPKLDPRFTSFNGIWSLIQHD
uniref:TMEM135_C_rich domain-containing protein n=2 Tax=Onchocerca TaxID=6281 RepID=A0A8R1XXD0_ONCVO